MKQKKQTKKQESGRSMIEMVGVLAVMGLITAGAFVLITSAMSSQKMSRVDDDVSAIVAATRLMYNSQDNFTNLDNTALGMMGFSGANANPYGGKYLLTNNTAATSGTLNGQAVNFAANESFYVGIAGLTQAQCNALKNRQFPGGSVKVEGCSAGTATDAGVVSFTCGTCTGTGANNAVRITYAKVQ